MNHDKIIIKNARTHNLKNISLEIPKNKIVVFTGVSGSGKSSLVFDTIYTEAQRIKLATELHKKGNIYVMDEPTTGLHMADIEKLLKIIKKLVDNNNTVIIIEHNLDVIEHADWIIDLGPEGGNRGGEILFEGTPEELVKCKRSYTGQFLKKGLDS